MVDNNNVYTWEAKINITTQLPDFKLKSETIEKYKNIIELELKPTKSYRDIFKSLVLVEKIGCNKTIENDSNPIARWMLDGLFSSNFQKQTRDFILIRKKTNLEVEKIWYLSECSLYNSDLFNLTDSDDICEEMFFNISILPKSIISQ